MAYSTIVLPPGLGGGSGGESGGSQPGGPFTSPLLAPFGTAAAPGYSFDGATNMGIYGVSLGVLGIASQGRQVAQIDQAGNLGITGGLTLSGGYLTQQAGSLLINTSQTTPVGNVVAPPGSFFTSSVGGSSGPFFKQSGTDASGWVALLGPRTPVFPILAPTSAASSLQVAFAGYTGTGLHSQAGELAFATGNSDRLVLGTDGSVQVFGPSILNGSLSVTGTTNLSGLSVQGGATLRAGASVLGGSLNAQAGLQVSGGTLAVTGQATFSDQVTISGLLTATAGSVLSGILTLDAGAKVINAPGDPRGNVSAPAGSVFLSSDGGASKTFFVKETGTDADGWTLGGSGSGQVVFPLFAPQSTDGTTPQYAFEGGSAGLLSPAAQTVALSTGDTLRLTIDGSGLAAFANNVSVAGSLQQTGPATFSSSASIGSTLQVGGASTLSGATTVSTTFRVQGDTTLNGKASVGGTLGVSGATTLAGILTSSAGAAFTGTTSVQVSAPLNLLGLVSLQAGSQLLNGSGSPQGQISAPPGSIYSDSTSGAVWVKSTGTDANGWNQVPTNGLGPSEFPLQAPDGSVSAPSYSFAASPGSGLYASGTDELSFATAQAVRFRLTQGGDAHAYGAMQVDGGLAVTGQGRFSGGVTLIGSGPLTVGGPASFATQVGITGPLQVGGNTTLNGNLQLVGPATLGSTLQVSGPSTLASLNAGSGSFSGALTFADGSVSLPGLALGSATGTGLFADSAHSGLGVSIAGSQVGYFSSAGYISLVGGQVGTATTYMSTSDGTAAMPAFSVNGRGGLYYDGTGIGLVSGTTEVLQATASGVSLLQGASVAGGLTVAGSLSVTGASTYTSSLVVGGAVQGQAASSGGALIAGQLAVGGGSVTAPGYAFLGATGTGLFADSPHQGIGVSIAGQQVGYFNAGGFTSTATGPSTPLIDLVVTSAASNNLTLAVNGSTTSVPTATLLGTYSSGSSYQQAGQIVFATKNTSGGATTNLYTLTAGGFPNSVLALSRVGGASILSYDDGAGVTTLGAPVSVSQLSATSKILLPTASNTSPGLCFTGNTGTGLYYDGPHSGIGITIAGTQIGYFNASGYNPLTGGTAMNVVAPIVTVNSGTYQLTAGQSGCFVNFTASATAALPAANAAAVGTYFTFMVGAASTTASVAIASANTSDTLYFVGGTVTAGQALTSQANRYALLSVECSALGQWTVSSIQGVWGGNGIQVSQTDTVISSPDSNNLTLDSSGAPGTSASARLISPSGNASLIRFASGTPASPTDVFTLSGLTSGTQTFKLTHTANAVDVLTYTDTSNTAATRSLVFGNINASGLRSLSVGANPVTDATVPVQLNAAATSFAGYSVTSGTSGNAVTLGYSNAAPGTATGGYLSTRLAQPMFFTANGLTQTALNYTSAGLVGVGSATASLSPLGVFGGVAIGSGVAGTTAAPTNGLLVQGPASLQSTLTVTGASTFNGNVTFTGGTTGVTAATTFPLAAPTGTTASPNYPYSFSGQTNSGLGFNTTNNSTTILNAGATSMQSVGSSTGFGNWCPTASDAEQVLQLNAQANVAANISYYSQGTLAFLLSYNNFNGGANFPLGPWLRAYKVGDPIWFTVTPQTTGSIAYGMKIASSATSPGYVTINGATNSLSPLGVAGGAAIGSGVYTTTAAPSNGLLVQGAVNLQSSFSVAGNSTFTGAVTFQGGTSGVSASFPLAAPTGTTASPNYAYSFTGATTSGLNYNTTTSNVVLSQNGTAALTVAGPSVGLGGYAAVSDATTPLQLSTPASVNRTFAFLNQGANGVTLGYNNDTGGPLGFWFRAKGTTDAFIFTTTNGTANAINYAMRIGANAGTSFGSSASGPALAVSTAGGVFSGPNFPSSLTAGIYYLASASAETGTADNNGVVAQVSSTGKLYARFSLADSNAAVGDLSYNKYTADGVPVSVNLNVYNKPFLLNVGADYTRTALSLYNVSNSYFANFGSRTQGLSTVSVTGNLAIGSTVAGGVAAPSNGLLVQGASSQQGPIGQGSATPTAAFVSFLTAATAITGYGRNGPSVQVGANAVEGRFDIIDGTTQATSLSYNKYTSDGVPVGTQLSAFNNKPLMFVVQGSATDLNAYTQIAASVYNTSASNTHFWNFGAKGQAASTVAVTGNLAVGSTVAGGTAAPANGLLVQGNAIVQGTLTVQGGSPVQVVSVPAATNVVATTAQTGSTFAFAADGTFQVPVATSATVGVTYTVVELGTSSFRVAASNSTDVITYLGGSKTFPFGASAYTATAQRGSSLQIICVSAGNWAVLNQQGSWS